MTTLLRKALRDGRGATIGWGIALIATIVMQIAIFPTVHDAAADFQNLLAAYPEAMRAMFSIQSDFATGDGYLHAEMFSLTLPLLLLGIAVAHGSAASALLAAVYGALALAVGASTGRRGLAIGVSVGAAESP